jgi:hypothetical protein
VIVEPFKPNEIPLELLKTTEPRLPEVVPAEKLIGEGAAVPAEIETLFPFCESVTFAPPARMSRPDEISARTPAVFPASDTASWRV